MKDKKAGIFMIITVAVISLILLFVFIGPIIKGIFVEKQVKFAGGKTEEVTIDCDGDDVIGFSDVCPCNKNKQEREELPCGDVVPPEAADICPKLCKE
tara:strand:- start:22 stop:315 length:294 start_codon:yes stop_codon:yes gene_type:complete